MQVLLEWDEQILLWIQENLRTPFWNDFFSGFTLLGDYGLLWILIGLVLMLPKKTRKAGFLTLLSLLGSLIINNMILKNLVARTRPYEVIDGLHCLIAAQRDLSFPSGHAGSSFAAGVMLFMTLPKKYSFIALVTAFLIAFSRLYVGVHYPSDVLAGMVTGTLIALGIFCISRWLTHKREISVKG